MPFVWCVSTSGYLATGAGPDSKVMDLLDFAADGTRQSEAGGQILEDAQWLRYDGRRLVDSPLIQCIVIGM